MERGDGKYAEIAPVPDKYKVNNPMSVIRCDAEVEITDWSNGKMKNVTAKVVVDTDRMNGDVLDLIKTCWPGLTRIPDWNSRT